MPVKLLYNLELTEDELTVIWAWLVMGTTPINRGGDAEQRRLEAAEKTALDKVQHLMEGT